MTVNELIEKLQSLPEDQKNLPVAIFDRGDKKSFSAEEKDYINQYYLKVIGISIHRDIPMHLKQAKIVNNSFLEICT